MTSINGIVAWFNTCNWCLPTKYWYTDNFGKVISGIPCEGHPVLMPKYKARLFDIKGEEKMGLDWKQLLNTLVPIVASAAPAGSKVDKALDWFKANPQIVTIVEGVVKQIHPDHAKPSPVIVPIDTPPSIPPITPNPLPVPTMSRTPASIGLKLFCVQQHSQGGQLYDKAAFDEIVALTNPCAPGDRIHLDATPVDTNGVPYQTGDPANEALNFKYFCSSDALELHAADHTPERNFGCTPVYKVPLDYQGEEIVTFNQTDQASGITSNSVKVRVKS